MQNNFKNIVNPVRDKSKEDDDRRASKRGFASNWVKKIIFAILPLLILLLVAETGARFMYFETTGKNRESFALMLTYKQIKFKILARRANRIAGGLPNTENLMDALYSPIGKDVLNSFEVEYEDNFKLLKEEADRIGSKLALLYLSTDFSENSHGKEASQQFFSQLAKKYGVEFLDTIDALSLYPEETVTLLPNDGHLSRFGNKIMAEELSKYIDKYSDYRADFRFDSKPKRFGDLSPNDNSIWQYNPNMPYRVIVNKQGLRMDYDLNFPKEKQRVLVLGDSYTFGPYLDNHDTYPALLDEKYPDKEIINAGISGYTITDEVSLFLERAKYTEPDIIILQVFDNDIPGLFYFKKNEFDRKKQAKKPSKVEIDFLNNLR